MAKKIVFIQGSPRKNGNTRTMAALAIEEARRHGALVEEVDAVEMEFKKPGCISCQQCQRSADYRCALDDQVAETVAGLPDHDVIALATPIFWWSYPAQVKILIDRMYSLTKFTDSDEILSPLTGKTLALLATGAGPVADNLDLLEEQWKHPASMLGCGYHSCLFPGTMPDGSSLINDPAAMERARAFGRLLAGVDQDAPAMPGAGA